MSPYYSAENNEAVLKMLNRHFKTTSFEKHPQVMLSLYFERACNTVLGKDYAKKRISKRAQEKIYKFVLTKLQNCYGTYINVTNFRAKDPLAIKFGTNFELVFKNEKGLIYGCSKSGLWSTVFFTTHCFERFEERCRSDVRSIIESGARIFLKAEPTVADLLYVATLSSLGNHEYSKKGSYYYMNIGAGFLILEDFNEFLLAKTFMTSDMVPKDLNWYMPLMTPEQNKNPSEYFKSLKEIFDSESIKINNPEFIDNRMDEITY